MDNISRFWQLTRLKIDKTCYQITTKNLITTCYRIQKQNYFRAKTFCRSTSICIDELYSFLLIEFYVNCFNCTRISKIVKFRDILKKCLRLNTIKDDVVINNCRRIYTFEFNILLYQIPLVNYCQLLSTRCQIGERCYFMKFRYSKIILLFSVF